MPLKSKLLSDQPRLQQCLLQDSAHVTPGATGSHVSKIQTGLSILAESGDPPIPGTELSQGLYGPKTADAVLLFKKRRDLINRSYQNEADNIVGKMTIAALDEELFDEENVGAGLTNPLLDPKENDRIQSVIDKERPGVLRMLHSTLASLNEVQRALQLHREDPAQSLPLEATNRFAIDGLRRFFGLPQLFSPRTSQDQQFSATVQRITDNFQAYMAAFPRLSSDQQPADFPTLLKDHPEEAAELTDPAPKNVDPAFSEAGKAMFFTPVYRERNPAMPLIFRGMFSETLESIQLHEMGHFYFGFDDGDPRGKPTEICLKLANPYNFLAQQVEFRHLVAP